MALVLASLAWLAFVLTQTIGDPKRGEEIAAAVLADPAARAEVTAPITAGVMTSFDLPPDQRPLVETQVDRLLATPTGAQTFVDPFAGSWARLLGEDDPRPTEFDLAPLLSQFVAETAALPDGIELPSRLPVPDVPMPRAQIDWMAGVRSVLEAAIVPLALAAAALCAVAFAMGERPRVLRRLGIWAIVAGGWWLVIPGLTVWFTRRWAPGADAVVAATLDEATSGLLVAATALVVGGGLALALSFVVLAAEVATRPQPDAPATMRRHPDQRVLSAQAQEVRAVPSARPSPRPLADTAEMPTVLRPGSRPAPTPAAGSPRPDEPRIGAAAASRDEDSVWEYYA